MLSVSSYCVPAQLRPARTPRAQTATSSGASSRRACPPSPRMPIAAARSESSIPTKLPDSAQLPKSQILCDCV
eukprot:2692053-Pleurochrysis_carterae.AAC.3